MMLRNCDLCAPRMLLLFAIHYTIHYTVWKFSRFLPLYGRHDIWVHNDSKLLKRTIMKENICDKSWFTNDFHYCKTWTGASLKLHPFYCIAFGSAFSFVRMKNHQNDNVWKFVFQPFQVFRQSTYSTQFWSNV